MAFVEDQVDHPQHAGQARRALHRPRHLVGNAGRGDLGLGAHDALRQRGRGHQAGGGDGLGAQAADLAQRERDARFVRQAGVAAGEHQAQAVVFDRPAHRRHTLFPARRGVGQGVGQLVVPGHEAPVAAQRSMALKRPPTPARPPGWPARRAPAIARWRPRRRRAALLRPGQSCRAAAPGSKRHAGCLGGTAIQASLAWRQTKPRECRAARNWGYCIGMTTHHV
jgi:hypothetical protein